jgi:hypothetical protein
MEKHSIECAKQRTQGCTEELSSAQPQQKHSTSQYMGKYSIECVQQRTQGCTEELSSAEPQQKHNTSQYMEKHSIEYAQQRTQGAQKSSVQHSHSRSTAQHITVHGKHTA